MNDVVANMGVFNYNTPSYGSKPTLVKNRTEKK